jgi:hypothetical protein
VQGWKSCLQLIDLNSAILKRLKMWN